MMNSYVAERLGLERMAEAVREAERDRQARRAEDAQAGKTRWVGRPGLGAVGTGRRTRPAEAR